LTKINVDAYIDWNTIIYNRKEKESVASATVRADFEIPQLRMTRKFLEGLDGVIWQIRSDISIMKKD
jgi:hypothetical protein